MIKFWQNITIFFLLSIFSLFDINAQQRSWVNFTTEDGLPTNYCYGAIEADDGTIWMFTEDGLVKFNGNNFQAFTAANGLTGNDFYLAERDRAGRVILSSFGNGIDVIENDKLITIPETENKLYFNPKNKAVVYSGDAYMSSKNEAYCLSPENRWTSPISLEVDKQKSIFEFPLSPYGLSIDYKNANIVFQNESNVNLIFNLKELIDDQNSFIIETRFDHKFNRIICIFKKGFVIFHTTNRQLEIFTWEQFGLGNNNTANAQYVHPFLFLQTEKGFLKMDSTSRIVDKFIVGSLSDEVELRRVISDGEGNIWAGSRDHGVFFLSSQNRAGNVIARSSKETGVFEKLVKLTHNKLVAFSEQGKVFLIIDNVIVKVIDLSQYGLFEDAILLPNGKILASFDSDVFELDANLNEEFYFNGLNKDDLSSLNHTLEDTELKSFKLNYRRIAWDHSSNSVLLNRYEVIQCSKENNGFEIHDHPIFAKDFYKSESKGVWFSAVGGIFKFSNNKINTFLLDEKLKYIDQIYEQENLLWVSTQEGFLYHIDISDKKILKESKVQFINEIVPGYGNTTFICTDFGLLKYKDEELVYTWKKSGGLSGNQIFDALETDDGIFVASNLGLDKIPNAMYAESNQDFEFELQDVLVNNQSINYDDGNIDLSNTENNIQFSFNLKDYTSGGDIQYFTRMLPMQKEWELREKGMVTYLGLASDDYNFELKARRFNGQEVFYEKQINVSIRPPWYKNPWTYIVAITLGFLGFYFTNKKQQKNRREAFAYEKEIAKRISELQLSALRSQMNPHFIFNALGAIQFFVQTKETEKADDYLSQFALLMRKYLEASKEPEISLKDEMELLKLYTDIEEMRFDHQFKVNFDCDKTIDQLDVKLPSVLIQPFVENSILHGLQPSKRSDGRLNVSIRPKEGDLVVKLTDNGIGLEKAKRFKDPLHKSRGLENIDSRIDTLKAANGIDIIIDRSIPFPEDEHFPGHEVQITFKNLLNET